ncbi:MAG: glycosyltransferase [Planctomycetes bacterium]|nr:glycosyltransferase [Planctomycetota bacterium]
MEASANGGDVGSKGSTSLPKGQRSTKTSVSLVLPAYNEQEVIVQAVQEADEALSSLTDDYEILVVDDGSTDDTAAIVEGLTEQYGHLRLLRQPKNFGYGAALRRGFEEATKELVGFTDADCQFDLNELSRLVMLSRDYQIVCGYRIDRQDPFLRCFYSNVYNTLVRTLLGTRVRDCDCALKLMHRDVLTRLPITTDGFLVNAVLLTQARQQELSVVEVGVSHRPRAAGESKVSITHIPLVLAALVRFWWNSVMFVQPAQLHRDGWTWKGQLAMGLLLLVLGGGALLSNLGYSLFEPDETRYAQIALNMYETGDWVVPRLNGEPYLDKPPLLYWLTATSYSLLGVNEQAARLPTALAALLTVLTTYVLGRRLLGDRSAAIGASLLLLSIGFFFAGRFVMMDSLLTLFTTIGLLAGMIALHADRKALFWWILAGVACGLGTLTKGPVAGVICIPPILAVAWLTHNRRVLRPQVAAAILLPVVAIAAPWFLIISSGQGGFSSHFFWTHHIQRFFQAFNHNEPWWFYLPVLAISLLPGSLLFGPLAIYLFGRGKKAGEIKTIAMRSQQLGAVLLAGMWIVVFFSLSSCKLPAYILPTLPMFCLVLGKMLHDILESEHELPMIGVFTQRARLQTLRLATVVCVVVFFVDLVFEGVGQLGLAVAFLIVPVMAWVGLRVSQQTAVGKTWLAAAVVCLIVSSYGFNHVIPHIADWRSLPHAAAVAQSQLGEPVPVVFFGRSRHGATFSIHEGEILEFAADQLEDFERYMDKHSEAVVVASPAGAEMIRQECRQSIELEGPTARGKVYMATTPAYANLQVGQRQHRNLK